MSHENGKTAVSTITLVGDRLTTIREHIRRLGEQLHVRVVTVATPSEAQQQRVFESGPILFLVDSGLPDAKGIDPKMVEVELVEELARHPRTLVMAISASDAAERNGEAAHYAGAVDSYDEGDGLEVLDRKVAACLERLKNERPGRPYGMSGPVPIDPAWARQLREKREWLSHPENLETYVGEVIAVYDGEVWGHGLDHKIALDAVRARIDRHAGEPGLPMLHEMTIIILDDWRLPDPPWSEEM